LLKELGIAVQCSVSRNILTCMRRRLWQQFLEETQRSLPLGLASQAAIALADASAQLAALGGTWAPLPGAGRPMQAAAAGAKPEGDAGQ
jgi:hypothetical protein